MKYWLVKSEPSEFSIDDLAAKDCEPWTGVRNYQARNFMRDCMEQGDQVLFYHSSIAIPAIVGLACVKGKAYPDPTQFDCQSDYYDSKSSPANPRWYLVDLIFQEKFQQPVTLDRIRHTAELANLVAARPGNRLSVSPVTESEFALICEMASSHSSLARRLS